MKQNIGSVDRTFRIVVGVALILWWVVGDNMIGLIGIIPLLTAVIKWCPLYCPVGISTVDKN